MKRKPELYTRPGKSNIILKNVLNNLRDSDSHNENKQITQCVFLGVLKLKPVPSIFYSNNPSPSAPLDCKLRRVRSSTNNKDIGKSSSNKPNINKVISGRISKKNPEKVRASVKKIPSKKSIIQIKFNMSDGSSEDRRPLQQSLRAFPENISKIVPEKTLTNPLINLGSPVSKQFNPVQNLFDKVKQKIGESYNNPSLTSTDFDSNLVEMRKSNTLTEEVNKKSKNSPKRSPKKKQNEVSEESVSADTYHISNIEIDSSTSLLSKQRERTSPRSKKTISPRNIVSDETEGKINETESDETIVISVDNSTDYSDISFVGETRISKIEDSSEKTTEKPKPRRSRLLPTAIPSIFLTAPRLLRSELAQKKPSSSDQAKSKSSKHKSDKGGNKLSIEKSTKIVGSKSSQYKRTISSKMLNNEDILFVSEEVKSPNDGDKPSLKLLIRQKKRSEIMTREENLSYEIAQSSVAVMTTQDSPSVPERKQEEENTPTKDMNNSQQTNDPKLLKSNIIQIKTSDKGSQVSILEKSTETIISAINDQNVNSTSKKKNDIRQERNKPQMDKPNLKVINEPNMIEKVKSDSFKHKNQLNELGENNNVNEELQTLNLEEKSNPSSNLEVNIVQKEKSSEIVEEQSASKNQTSPKEKTTDKTTKKVSLTVLSAEKGNTKELQTRSLPINISQLPISTSEHNEAKSMESKSPISNQKLKNISTLVEQTVSKVAEKLTETEKNEVQEKMPRTLRSQKLGSEKVELEHTIEVIEDLTNIGQDETNTVIQEKLIKEHTSEENIVGYDNIKTTSEEIHETDQSTNPLKPENIIVRRSVRSIKSQKAEVQEKSPIDPSAQSSNKNSDIIIIIDDDSANDTNKSTNENLQEISKKQDKLKENKNEIINLSLSDVTSNEDKTKGSKRLKKSTNVGKVKRQANPKLTISVSEDQKERSRKRKSTADPEIKRKIKKTHQSNSRDVSKPNADLKPSEIHVLQRSLRSQKAVNQISANKNDVKTSKRSQDHKENKSRTTLKRAVSKRKSDVSKVLRSQELSNISSPAKKTLEKDFTSKKRHSVVNTPLKNIVRKENRSLKEARNSRNSTPAKASKKEMSVSKVKDKLSKKNSKTVLQIKHHRAQKPGKTSKQKEVPRSNLRNKNTNTNSKLTKQTPTIEKKVVKKTKNAAQAKEKKVALKIKTVKVQVDKKSQKNLKLQKPISQKNKTKISKKTEKTLSDTNKSNSMLKKVIKAVDKKPTVLAVTRGAKVKNLRSTRSKNNRFDDEKLKQKTKLAKTNIKKLNKAKTKIVTANSSQQKKSKVGLATQNKPKLKLKAESTKGNGTPTKKKIALNKANLERSKKQLLKQSKEIRKSKKKSFFSKKLLIERIIKTTLKQLNVQKQLIRSSKILRARARAKLRRVTQQQQQEVPDDTVVTETKEEQNSPANVASNSTQQYSNVEVLAVVPDEAPAKPDTTETPLIVISGMNSGDLFQEVVYTDDNVGSQTVEITADDINYTQIKEFFESEKRKYTGKSSNNDDIIFEQIVPKKNSKKEKQNKSHLATSKKDVSAQSSVTTRTNIAGPSHPTTIQNISFVSTKTRKAAKEKTSEEELDQILSASEAVLQNIEKMTMDIPSSQNNTGSKTKSLEKGDLTVFDFDESETETETAPLRHKVSAKKDKEKSDQNATHSDESINVKKSPLKQATILEMFNRVAVKNKKPGIGTVRSIFTSTPNKSQSGVQSETSTNEETETSPTFGGGKFEGRPIREIQKKCMQLNMSMSSDMPPPATPKVVKKVGSNTNEEEEVEIFDDDDSRSEWMPQELAEYKFKYSAKKVMSYKPIFKCKVCLTIFPSYYKLTKHKVEHVEVQNPYACKLCGQNFKSVDDLVAHIKIHKGKHPYVCQKCDQGFWTKKDFDSHGSVHVLRKTKEPVKKFQCDVCKKQFAKMSDAERHSRVHTGEKPFVCNICNKHFQQSHNLSKHLLIHLHVKPFSCEICGKQFGRIDVLNRHILTHSITKPFKCPICPKDFIRASQLNHHIKKDHPEALNTEIGSEIAELSANQKSAKAVKEEPTQSQQDSST